MNNTTQEFGTTIQSHGGPEENTGDQIRRARLKRGRNRYPSWELVEEWRARWDEGTVRSVLKCIGSGASKEKIADVATTGLITTEIGGKQCTYPDLRGLDVSLLPIDEREQAVRAYSEEQEVDLSYARLEGARLTDLDLSRAILYRTQLQKATLRRVQFRNATLKKVHIEDADFREVDVTGPHMGFVRYTEDSWLTRGTVFIETNLSRALVVDPLLKRYAEDQSYLYVYKYRSGTAGKIWYKIWWLTSNHGKSIGLWFVSSLLIILSFALLYLPAPEWSSSWWQEVASTYGPTLDTPSVVNRDLITCIYFSFVTFTTLGFGDVIPTNEVGQALVILEVIVGYLMFGILVSILANKVARRA